MWRWPAFVRKIQALTANPLLYFHSFWNLLGQGEENDAEMEEAPVDDPPEEKDGLLFFF